MYVVADHNFKKFAVVHYTDLTTEDFRPLSTGARGKTQMKKYSAHDRANVLLGSFLSINEIELKKLRSKINTVTTPAQKRRIEKSINYWLSTPTKFKIVMEDVSD